jgi:hypothetical protein
VNFASANNPVSTFVLYGGRVPSALPVADRRLKGAVTVAQQHADVASVAGTFEAKVANDDVGLAVVVNVADR